MEAPRLKSLLGILICIGLLWGTAAPMAQARPLDTPLAALPGLGSLFAGTPPQNLGVKEGSLAPCPQSPNCVVSQGNADETHAIEPITYGGELETARATVIKVLGVLPRTTLIESSDRYIRFEAASRLMGFVDDGEFYFPDDAKVIHLRSAARLGESDLGVNRRRLEQVRLALKDLGI